MATRSAEKASNRTILIGLRCGGKLPNTGIVEDFGEDLCLAVVHKRIYE